MAVVFLTAPVQLSPTYDGTYVDVDVSANVPSGATGIILELFNNTIFENNSVSIRNNGSTDDLPTGTRERSHTWFFVGVDSNRVFETKVTLLSTIKFWLYGYFNSESVFLTNSVDSGITSDFTWTDVNISATTGADTATAAIGYFNQTGTSGGLWGVRKNGSTDTMGENAKAGGGFIIGCDGSEIFEGYTADDTTRKIKIVGYMTAGVTADTNATDVSLGSTGSYIDLAALPSGALGGIYYTSPNGSNSFNWRKNGDSTDRYQRANNNSTFGVVECDASQLVEGKIVNTAVDFFQIGYFQATGRRRTSLIC